MSIWELTYAITLLLLPPGCLVLAAMVGLAIVRRRPALAKSLMALSLIALYALSTQYIANHLLRALEPGARDPLVRRDGQAIVVLGAGKYYAAPEYGADTVDAETLMRLRYAAHLYRASGGKPVLVSGGSPEGSQTDEASAMKTVLEREFQVPVTWREGRSNNTLENARLSVAILRDAGVRTIYLVTHAWHIPRAAMAFEHAGVIVIPAPTGFATAYRLSVKDFLPTARALLESSRFFHEFIGIAWYQLKFLIARWACPAGRRQGTKMKARIKWMENVCFVGESESGHALVMDGAPEGGGRNLGPRPMETVLIGTGGCTAYDVVHILRKARAPISDCVVEITAGRAPEDPKVFTSIHFHFIVTGRGLKAQQVERAVHLSAEKYCSASIMLAKTAAITHDYEIKEEVS